jgi:hypothetical protein
MFGTAKSDNAKTFRRALVSEPGQLRLARPALLAAGELSGRQAPAAVDTLVQAIRKRKKQQDEETSP